MFFDYDGIEEDVKPSKEPVKLNEYTGRPMRSYELMTDQELVACTGGYFVSDIEIYPNYFLIAFREINSQKYVLFEKWSQEDKIDARKLYWIMHNCTVIGFNYLKFDLLLLWLAHSQASITTLKYLADSIVSMGFRPSDMWDAYSIDMPKTKIIDLIEVCPLKGSLKAYGARHHCERLQELPFPPDTRLTDDEKRSIRDYCFNDLDITLLLFNSLLSQLKLRDELSKEYREDLMSKSDAQIAEAVISAEVARITGNRPKKQKVNEGQVFNYKVPEWMTFQSPIMQNVLEIVATAPYTVQANGRVNIPDNIKSMNIRIGDTVYRMGNGGLHSSEKAISHVSDDTFSLIDRDVASYYPAIVLNSRLYPEHLGSNFLVVYSTLVSRRLLAKRNKEHTVADSLKIVINGSFGKLGSPHSVLYAPELMIQVTLTGQLALLMLIEALEAVGVCIVSANTDGIVMKVERSRRWVADYVVHTWETATNFDTEDTTYKAVYSRDVNAYIAVKEDNSCKGKNVFFDPWSGGSKAAIFKFHKNPQHTICIEAVNQLLTVGTPLAQTITSCKDIKKFICVRNVKGGAHKGNEYLGKVVRWYYARGERGTINYVLNNNKVPDSDGARPLMDLPTCLPNDLDFTWYIAKAKSMLIAIGHTRAPGEQSLI